MHWQQALSSAITDPEELINLLELDYAFLEPAKKATALFPLKIPRAFLSRIKKGNPYDPLLLQFLPLGLELEDHSGFTKDPLNELAVNPEKGLLHKYRGRVLLTLTSVCGVNCRFCFRRHFPYEDNNPGTTGWEKTLEYIAKDKSISEVILSGGDPLVASDNLLNQFSKKLALIPHIKRLRIHSRMPIVLPERICDEFLQWIKESPLKIILVTHSNHPNEINEDVKMAMQKLQEAKVTLLNQSVLLKKINDDAKTLIHLSEALFEAGILPYYLHVLDKVQGSAHFDMAREKAFTLHQEMSACLPGFLVPKLVCEQPGAQAKTPIVSL
jgi:EF-P beta-lysylation protein EpmB